MNTARTDNQTPRPSPELMAALDFTEADLTANRKGSVSTRQSQSLRQRRARQHGPLIQMGRDLRLAGILLLLMVGGACLYSSAIGAIIAAGVVLAGGMGLAAIYAIDRQELGRDTLPGTVLKLSGVVLIYRQPQEERYTIHVGGRYFKVNEALADAFEASPARQTVYYAAWSDLILSAEPAPDEATHLPRPPALAPPPPRNPRREFLQGGAREVWVEAADEDALAVLLAAMPFDRVDLEANRDGRFSFRQNNELFLMAYAREFEWNWVIGVRLWAFWLVSGALGMLAAGFYGLHFFVLAGILAAFMAFLLITNAGRTLQIFGRTQRDRQRGQVLAVGGPLAIVTRPGDVRRPRYDGAIRGERLLLSDEMLRHLQANAPYVAYFAPESHVLLSIEPAEKEWFADDETG